MPRFNLPAILLALALAAPLMSCGLDWSDTVPASISGVNYTDQDIRYMLFDPASDKQKTLAGEDLGPYSAGGVTCCYPVPKKWKAGTKVGVRLDVFDVKTDGYLPRQTFVIDLPPYDKSGKAGDVWFIRYPDGTVSVVSTAYRPNSDLWPGNVKGWPVPSLAYQRERWELYMRLAQESLKYDRESLEELQRDSKGYLRKKWAFYLKFNEEHVAQAKEPSMFTGPDDPAFLAHERNDLEQLVKYSQEKVNDLLKKKP